MYTDWPSSTIAQEVFDESAHSLYEGDADYDVTNSISTFVVDSGSFFADLDKYALMGAAVYELLVDHINTLLE